MIRFHDWGIFFVISCDKCISFFGGYNSGDRRSKHKLVSPNVILSTWIWISSICRRMWRNTTSNWVITSINLVRLVATSTNRLSRLSNASGISPSTFILSIVRWKFSDTMVACFCMGWTIAAFIWAWLCRCWFKFSRSLLFAVLNRRFEMFPLRLITPWDSGISDLLFSESIFATGIEVCGYFFSRWWR